MDFDSAVMSSSCFEHNSTKRKILAVIKDVFQKVTNFSLSQVAVLVLDKTTDLKASSWDLQDMGD